MKSIIVKIAAILVVLVVFDFAIGGGFWVLKKIGGGKMFYRYFDYREEYIAFAMNNKSFFSTFLSDFYDPIIGWNNPNSKHLTSKGCEGKWEAFYNDDGSRKSTNTSSDEKYFIICVGDSFTHGNEVGDLSTYPAFLQRMSNVKVGNYGVGGYDVLQSVLQYENVLKRIDAPRIGVLCIMYENGRRNLNAFRPVYSNSVDLYETFFFKPYFNGTRMASSVIQSDKNTFDLSLQKADTMFTDDFWAKPKFAFPYSLSLIRAMTCPYFQYMAYQKMNRMLGRGMYTHDFNTPIILDGMRYCVKRFVEASRERNIFPIVVFVPPNTQDLSSPSALITQLQSAYTDALILNFGDHVMDWSQYMIREGCHPTPAGYKEIANFIHTHILDRKLLVTSQGEYKCIQQLQFE
jgi:hypothetical protein